MYKKSLKLFFSFLLGSLVFSLISSNVAAATWDQGPDKNAVKALEEYTAKMEKENNYVVDELVSEEYYKLSDSVDEYKWSVELKLPDKGNGFARIYYKISNYHEFGIDDSQKQAYDDGEFVTTILGLEAVDYVEGPDIEQFDPEDPSDLTGYYARGIKAFCGNYMITSNGSIGLYDEFATSEQLRILDKWLEDGVSVAKSNICGSAQAAPDTVALTGRVVHIDGKPFEGVEVLVKVGPKNYDKVQTDKDGKYTVEIEKGSQNAKVYVSKDGYIHNSVIKINSPYTVDDLIVATKEEYEGEVKRVLANFLRAAKVSEADAKKIAGKLTFDYESSASFEYKWNVMYLSNGLGENYWTGADWETVCHELSHHVMRHLAYDFFADIIYDDHNLNQPSNDDTAYDEGRAHMFSILMLNYAENTNNIVIKNEASETWSYDATKVKAKYPNNEISEVEAFTTQFWLGYYGNKVNAYPQNVLNDILGIQKSYYDTEGREIRSINEWLDTKIVHIWEKLKRTDLMKLAYYNRLVHYAQENGLKSTLPIFTLSNNAKWEFDYEKLELKIAKGVYDIKSGYLRTITVGEHEIQPHSSFVIDASDPKTILVWLRDGKLDILYQDEKIGTIKPENGLKKLTSGSIKNLSTAETKQVKTTIEFAKYTANGLEGFLEDTQEVAEANYDNMEGSDVVSGYEETTGSWLVVFIGVFIFVSSVLPLVLFRKKKIHGCIRAVIAFFIALFGLIVVILSWPSTTVYEAGTVNEDVEDIDEVVEDNETDPMDDYGIVFNEDYGFSIDVGDFATRGFFIADEVGTAGEADLIYCVDTAETQEYSLCDSEDLISIFIITVMSQEEYAELEETDPMSYELAKKLGETDNYVYLLSHPNGFLPEDVALPNDFYDTIEDSFTVSQG